MLRGIGVSVCVQPVHVPRTHTRNHEGTAFAVLITRLTDDQPPGICLPWPAQSITTCRGCCCRAAIEALPEGPQYIAVVPSHPLATGGGEPIPTQQAGRTARMSWTRRC